MVDLVAKRPRQQIFSANLKRFALRILRLHRHKLRPHHVPAKSRYRKASFFFPLFAFRVNNLRIHQHNLRFRIFSARHVHHRHPQTFPDLRRCQPHSLRRIHRREHVLGQLFQRRIKLGDRRARLFQHRVAVLHHVINFSRRTGRLRRRGNRFRTGQFVRHSSRNSASSPAASLLQIFAEKHRPAQAPPSLRPPPQPPAPRTSPTARTPPPPAPSSLCPPSSARAAASKSVSSIRARSRLRRS